MASNNRNAITLVETDEVNHPTATYVYTKSQKQSRNGAQTGRIDHIVSGLYLVFLRHH